MTKNICISGYYGFDNFGDETILKVLIQNIKEYESYSEITVFSSNPDKTALNYGVSSVNSFDIKNVLKSLWNADYLISGGGSLLQDVTSIKSLIYYLGIIIIAQLFLTKTIIFAQGIGPINNKFLAKVTAFVLKRAKYVCVRDEKSQKLLSSWGVKSHLCADPVWNLDIDATYKTKNVGVQLRGFHSITTQFLTQLADFINKKYSDRNISILSLQNKLDLNVSNEFKDILLNINPELKVEIIENTSNEKVVFDISSFDTLIAMRYHACLVAIKSGVKLLPINYDIKVQNLAQMFNLKYLDMQNLSENEAIFDEFSNKDISYSQEKINSLMFDFDEFEEWFI